MSTAIDPKYYNGMTELGATFWQILPRICHIDIDSGITLAEKNLRLALQLIDKHANAKIDKEQMLLWALDREVGVMEQFIDPAFSVVLPRYKSDLLAKLMSALTNEKRDFRLADDIDNNGTLHIYVLALTAWYIAKLHAPKLNREKVLTYALVSELPEAISPKPYNAYTGWRIERDSTAEDLAKVRELLKADNPALLSALDDYTSFQDDEARFVLWLGIITPVLSIHCPVGRKQFFDKLGTYGVPEIQKWDAMVRKRLLAEGRGRPPEVCEALLTADHNWLIELVREHKRKIAEGDDDDDDDGWI